MMMQDKQKAKHLYFKNIYIYTCVKIQYVLTS